MFSQRKPTDGLTAHIARVGIIGAAFCGGPAHSAEPQRNEQSQGASAVPTTDIDSKPSLDRIELRELAKEAYVWGWPLVYMHQLRVALERVPFPAVTGGVPVAPLNQLSMLSDVIRPGAAAIPCANRDVMYGFGLFDLKEEAVVLQVPDFGDRFWLYQLGDQRTDSFARVGRMHATSPGFYLVVGPDWDKPTPKGITEVFRCPTRYGYCLPRVLFENSNEDRMAALPVVHQIAAYPLSQFDGSMHVHNWSEPRWVPSRLGRSRNVSPQKFFDVLPQVLEDVPYLPGEEGLYARLRVLLEEADRDQSLRAELSEIARAADRDLIAPLFEFQNIGHRLPGNWTTIRNGGRFGTDFKTRTAAAKSNVFVNLPEETSYYYLDLDEQGNRLNGSSEYRITFAADALPPARGFWSLTLYDERHLLPEGTDGQLSIGSRDPHLVFEEDGSLTIVISRGSQHDGGLAGSNRLHPPEGAFSLYLRVYWPEENALDGSWTPPAVRKVSRDTDVADEL